MKKILCCVLCFVTLFCSIAVFAVTSPTISLVSDSQINSGQTFDVYVAVTENSNICGGRITIAYDNTAMEIVSIATESLLNGIAILQNPDYTESSARISWAGVSNIISGGNLLKLTFKAKTIYEDTNALINIQEMKYTDSDGYIIPCNMNNASILIKAKSLPRFYVECPDEALIGSNINVKVNISENSLVCGGRFDLVYDNTRLEIVSSEAGSVLSSVSNLINPDKAVNKIRLSWAGTSELYDSGTLLNVTFKVLNVPGEAVFSFENQKMSDNNDLDIECAAIGKSVNAVTELVCSTNTDYVEEDGQWKFSSAIKNCPDDAILIVAIYNDNQMVGMVKENISNDATKDVYLKKAAFDKAEVFVWKSFETLTTLSASEEITNE